MPIHKATVRVWLDEPWQHAILRTCPETQVDVDKNPVWILEPACLVDAEGSPPVNMVFVALRSGLAEEAIAWADRIGLKRASGRHALNAAEEEGIWTAFKKFEPNVPLTCIANSEPYALEHEGSARDYFCMAWNNKGKRKASTFFADRTGGPGIWMAFICE